MLLFHVEANLNVLVSILSTFNQVLVSVGAILPFNHFLVIFWSSSFFFFRLFSFFVTCLLLFFSGLDVNQSSAISRLCVLCQRVCFPSRPPAWRAVVLSIVRCCWFLEAFSWLTVANLVPTWEPPFHSPHRSRLMRYARTHTHNHTDAHQALLPVEVDLISN